MTVTDNENRRKVVVGIVTSDKMDKTLTVKGVRTVKHPRYGKYIKKSTVYKVHDGENTGSIGDKVEIVEARPLSKTKRWDLVQILK